MQKPIKILFVKDYENDSVQVLLVYEVSEPKEYFKDAIRAYDSYWQDEGEEEELDELVDKICKYGSTMFGEDEFFIGSEYLYTETSEPSKTTHAADCIKGDEIVGILYDCKRYQRNKLAVMSEQELYDTALEGEAEMYTLDEISALINDEEFPDFDKWLFFVNLKNVKH